MLRFLNMLAMVALAAPLAAFSWTAFLSPVLSYQLPLSDRRLAIGEAFAWPRKSELACVTREPEHQRDERERQHDRAFSNSFADAASSTPKTGPSLAELDPEMAALIRAERQRQVRGIELIASENFASRAVLEALGSVLTNKYSEGQPGARYYGGNEHIDAIERLCQARALKLFRLNPEQWAVNVQPYSGSPANFAAYTALLAPHDRIMGLDLPSGGHLTHGYYNAKRKVSATSIFFESLPYQVDPTTGLVDYDALERQAVLFRPRLIVAGASAYAREWDYARIRRICDSVGAIMMTDMAHISGLVAAGEAADPFEYSDVVTSTTHKSLRGPRAGVIFCRRALKEAVDFAVFPSLQGGPHNHQIGALAVALAEADTDGFRDYIQRVKANARALAAALVARGYTIATGGTDNHLILWDVRPQGLTGSKVEAVLEACAVSVNKNTLPGDANAVAPGGVRLGTPAMTTRGLTEEDFAAVADFLHRGVGLALELQEAAGSKKMADFRAAMAGHAGVAALRGEVEAWSEGFFFPGLDVGGEGGAAWRGLPSGDAGATG